ncbi:MAG: NADP-dependent phosphogluconate dehydrogenase [Betaproteobacteria bacterium]
MQEQDMGLIGLGVMGENLALNIERHGFSVCGFDSAELKRITFSQRTQGLRAEAATSLQAMVERLKRPKRLLLMVPAGSAVDAVLAQLTELLEPGDVVMDGGNSHYADTARRQQQLQAAGLHFIGVGVSGGEQGALLGPALMPGGDERAWSQVKPLLQAIAARSSDGMPCCQWMGPQGAGHFVKMVHNGIEYADMQAICEAYWLMHQMLDMPAQAIGQEFARWSEGELGSYLLGISAEILQHTDPDSGQALVDLILDTAEQKGTGKWASQAALDLGAAAPTMNQAVFARTLSAMKTERVQAAGALAGARTPARPDAKATLPLIRDALMATKISAYAQGFALMQRTELELGWPLPVATIAKLWQAGCIIRARLLEDIARALDQQSTLPNLLLDSDMAQRMSRLQQDLREVVALGALQGLPLPAFMSALNYYDAYRSMRLPANLLQAQRDYFGAHGYQRVDKPGQFHTRWSA